MLVFFYKIIYFNLLVLYFSLKPMFLINYCLCYYSKNAFMLYLIFTNDIKFSACIIFIDS